MLRGKKEILLRVATLKQQERDLRDEFNQAVLADQETQQIEAMLVAIGSEIAVCEAMISHRS